MPATGRPFIDFRELSHHLWGKWDFLVRRREKLSRNVRMGMMYRTWDRMEKPARQEILSQARKYREHLETL